MDEPTKQPPAKAGGCLLSVKNEGQGSASGFEKIFLDRYYNAASYSAYWYKDSNDPFPTIGKTQGKVILMPRSGLSDKLGIDFHIGNNKSDCRNVTTDKDGCNTADSNLQVHYKDLYEPDSDGDKVKAVKSTLKNAQNEKFAAVNHKHWSGLQAIYALRDSPNRDLYFRKLFKT